MQISLLLLGLCASLSDKCKTVEEKINEKSQRYELKLENVTSRL
jgi:hypothetical protein